MEQVKPKTALEILKDARTAVEKLDHVKGRCFNFRPPSEGESGDRSDVCGVCAVVALLYAAGWGLEHNGNLSQIDLKPEQFEIPSANVTAYMAARTRLDGAASGWRVDSIIALNDSAFASKRTILKAFDDAISAEEVGW